MSFLKIEHDPSKRYLIIGDIHGQMDSLFKLLQKCDYDEKRDVLITTGDMIDRGPDSINVVEFFCNHEKRHSVLGNHELMAINHQKDFPMWQANGGYQTLTDMYRRRLPIGDLVKNLKALPVVLEVGDQFRVVHADLPGGWNDEEIRIAAENNTPDELQGLLWSRETVIHGEPRNGSSGIRKIHTYCGHSRMEQMTTIGDITFIDREDALMAVNPITGDTWEVKAR
jgi:serine/threonine protein phosphatase 1